ncbi:FAD-binding oxidoreductase [Aspergillus saccharolyticus JOP 1030-1]|uniref:Oxidoreductase, FAD-binding protein n=1 Tax=Aspergillus saccharolyticus JOP 1030-1 TaxID=1450539 RepID=A0A318YZ31_9EURO|nr:oxidoreductase, FAD-binding protein [Aspergillus saccharolyticus JOP 1030-1]PYH40225.1 oxidoreductase, FAD-binding protein [Aspergillus saccharolyticus JOP 1030-1]
MAPPEYITHPEYSSKVLLRGDSEYERCRVMNPSAAAPRYPREIHLVESVADVQNALKRAAELGTTVSVRSSGHAAQSPYLVQDGIMIDTTNLNRRVDYDEDTQQITFGPSCRIGEVSQKLSEVGRFFPFGHAPTVAMAGYLLAGGQGFFMRGYGAAVTFVTRMEIALPNGDLVLADSDHYSDLFWAARGSGLGFFGVVTRFWGRTIPAKTPWQRTLLFEINSANYEKLMTWAIECGRATPKEATDLNLAIAYAQDDPDATGDDVPAGAKLHLTLLLYCYANSEDEAHSLLSAYDQTDEVADCMLDKQPAHQCTFEEILAAAEAGPGPGARVHNNSILSDPGCSLSQLLAAMKPALLELPTRLSNVYIYHCDQRPDESQTVLSLPLDLYLMTATIWTDPQREAELRQHIRERYERALSVAGGMFVFDLDPTWEEVNTRVITDTALQKFLQIRDKYDPQGLFPNYQAFVRADRNARGLLRPGALGALKLATNEIATGAAYVAAQGSLDGTSNGTHQSPGVFV